MYLKHFKLKAKPFQLTPDPRFFYGSKSHKRAMAYLLYGVKQGEGFIVVTGNVGTGKTTLVNNLLKLLKKENIIAAQIVTTQIEEDDLLRMVATSFGLPSDDLNKATILRNLELFFKTCHKEGKRVLLVIDEAQNLPKRSIEELRMLSNFQIGGKSLVQSFLLGQKEFRDTMRTPGFEQLRQRVIAAYHLRPLDVNEARGYIEHRLKVVGWDDNPHFSQEAFEGIQEFTDGIPRRINLFCDRLMLYVYLEEKNSIDLEAVKTVAKDIVEEQGGVTQEGNAMPVVKTAENPDGVINTDLGEKNSNAVPHVDKERIDAVEASVSALTDAMRDEMSALRKALAEALKNAPDKN